MNKRALFIGLIYSCIVIIYKLIILLGGFQLSKFGFYYSHILSVFLIIPFMIYAVWQVREKDMGGTISGRNAMNIAMSIAGVSILILSAYQYIEFEWKLKEISVIYYNSDEYLHYLKKNPQLKPENYEAIIKDNIEGLSAFKSITAKLFSFLFISISSAFITSVFMKRN